MTQLSDLVYNSVMNVNSQMETMRTQVTNIQRKLSDSRRRIKRVKYCWIVGNFVSYCFLIIM